MSNLDLFTHSVFVPFYLVADLGRGIFGLAPLIPPEVLLRLTHLLGALCEGGHGGEVKVRVEMPEEGTRNANLRAVGLLLGALLHLGNRGLIDSHLVEPSLDEAAGNVLELLAGLHEEVVSGGHADGDAAACVARPDVETRVAAAAVDGEEVEVRVEAGEDGVERAVLGEVGGSRGEEMGAVWCL